MQAKNTVEINVGKSGINPEVHKHIKSRLKKHKLIKVRFLKTTGIDYGSLPGVIVKRIGRTVVLKEK